MARDPKAGKRAAMIDDLVEPEPGRFRDRVEFAGRLR